MRAERHADFRTTVEIEGQGRSRTVVAEMAGRWAAIGFRSQPSGAAVVVDGKRAGVTPLTADLMEGRHRYELVLAGYKPYRDVLTVEAEKPRQLPDVTLEWADATLSLISEPEGANVTVGGDFRGRAPVDLELAPGRTHEIEVSRARIRVPASRDPTRAG